MAPHRPTTQTQVSTKAHFMNDLGLDSLDTVELVCYRSAFHCPLLFLLRFTGLARRSQSAISPAIAREPLHIASEFAMCSLSFSLRRGSDHPLFVFLALRTTRTCDRTSHVRTFLLLSFCAHLPPCARDRCPLVRSKLSLSPSALTHPSCAPRPIR